MVFYKRNRIQVLCVSIELEEGRTWKSCGSSRMQLVFPQHFLFSQTSTHVSALKRNTVRVFYFLSNNQCNILWQLQKFLCTHWPIFMIANKQQARADNLTNGKWRENWYSIVYCPCTVARLNYNWWVTKWSLKFSGMDSNCWTGRQIIEDGRCDKRIRKW